MIYESRPWKTELKKICTRLKKRIATSEWTDRTFVSVEKDIFFSVYIIRKLMEAKKLSDELEATLIKLTTFSFKPNGHLTFYNWHDLDRHYDLSKSLLEQRSLEFLVNQLIHSYVFMVSFDEDDIFEGIFFTSDRNRREKLFFVSVSDFLDLLLLIANDDVVSLESRFNPKTGDYDIKKSSI